MTIEFSGQAENRRGDIAPPVYLDNQSTTPMDPRVLDAMMPFFTERYGNPASSIHAYGRDAGEAVDNARAQVADLIGADPREIVFTSGATESNNLAIVGAARFTPARRNHIVTLATEHKCVLESTRYLEREGFPVTILQVRSDGLVDLDALAEAITDRTLLVSVMAAHNEIGVLQPLAEIGTLCRERGAYFHVDAAQGAGKIPLDVDAMNVDLMSVSGHKMYGPKGIGALYVRRRPRVRLAPLVHGGGQERGMRSGTLATPLIVGLGAAAAIVANEMTEESERLGRLRDRLLDGLNRRIDGLVLAGAREPRLAGNLNLLFPDVEADALLTALSDVAASTGSACSTAAIEPSYVIRALGFDEAAARRAVRFAVGRFTTEAEIDRAIAAIADTVLRLQAGSVEDADQRAGSSTAA